MKWFRTKGRWHYKRYNYSAPLIFLIFITDSSDGTSLTYGTCQPRVPAGVMNKRLAGPVSEVGYGRGRSSPGAEWTLPGHHYSASLCGDNSMRMRLDVHLSFIMSFIYHKILCSSFALTPLKLLLFLISLTFYPIKLKYCLLEDFIVFLRLKTSFYKNTSPGCSWCKHAASFGWGRM